MPQVVHIHEFNGGALISGAPIGFLTASSVAALYRAWGRPWEAAFVVSSYANILLLLWCLRELENVRLDNLQKRRRLKAAILCLAIILNVSFCHQVAKMMPPIVSALLWSMVVLVGIGGLRLFFPTANPWNGARRWWLDVRSSFFG